MKKKPEVSVKLKGDPKGTKVSPVETFFVCFELKMMRCTFFKSPGFEAAVPCARCDLLLG